MCECVKKDFKEIVLIGHTTSTFFFFFCMSMAAIHKKVSAFVKAPERRKIEERAWQRSRMWVLSIQRDRDAEQQPTHIVVIGGSGPNQLMETILLLL